MTRRGSAGMLLLLHALLGAGGVRAQSTSALEGRVLDALNGAPVVAALVVLRPIDAAATSPRRAITDSLGRYSFRGLVRGVRYSIRVERFGYRTADLQATLDRSEPLSMSFLLEPVALHLDPLALRGLRRPGYPRVSPAPPGGARASSARGSDIRLRQQRFLSNDVRLLSPGDLRDAHTLAEDDVFRALHNVPGVARRDDFAADLWTRGASAGQTVVGFDGIPVVGALHMLGIFSGFNPDVLHEVTFQRGVPGASSQGGGAGVIHIESTSPARGVHARGISLSPISARASADGTVSDRLAWAAGVRRSHVDLVSAIADGLVPGNGELRYAFRDIAARADLFLSSYWRIEASTFAQDDRVFGEVADVARGNEGEWGTRVGRASLVGALHGLELRSTLGVSEFRATIRTSPAHAAEAVHPTTDNRYRTVLWDGRIQRRTGTTTWRAGLTAQHDRLAYDGPDVDPASLLTSESLARHGSAQITPIALAIERARRVRTRDATRLAAWTERRARVGSWLEYDAGVRLETGSAAVDGRLRIAPRIAIRYGRDEHPLSFSAAFGRTYQYTQSVARTDVLRAGLRASEVLVLADRETWPLRSDLLTFGAELWRGDPWLLEATAWWRGSGGILLPRPASGRLDGPPPTVAASGRAHGLELSARRLEGPVRGFANYSLSRARHRVGSRDYDAAEDRRHIANVALTADVADRWTIGSTFRYESGAPYTRVIVVTAPCAFEAECDDEAVPVMLGAMNAQRGPAFASLDVTAEWTHQAKNWSLSVYAQLRNALGRANAVTYHSSCVCSGEGEEGGGWLGDRFDSGLPRLPLIGVRARF